MSHYTKKMMWNPKEYPAILAAAKPIKWGSFLKHVPVADVRMDFSEYNFKGSGQHIKDDRGVSFMRSVYNGVTCCFIHKRHEPVAGHWLWLDS